MGDTKMGSFITINTFRQFQGGTLPSTGMWQGEVFAISDCLV